MKSKIAIILRIYDYLISSLAGLFTAMLVFLVISPKWSMLPGMLTGMVLGLAVLMLIIICLGWIAGSFEIIMPGKFIVMIVGMGGGMWVTMAGPPAIDLALFGVFTGIAVAGVFHIYDNSLHGEQL